MAIVSDYYVHSNVKDETINPDDYEMDFACGEDRSRDRALYHLFLVVKNT